MLLVLGAALAVLLKSRDRPGGKLDTKLKGVSASVATNGTAPIKPPKKRKGRYHLVDDKGDEEDPTAHPAGLVCQRRLMLQLGRRPIPPAVPRRRLDH